MIPRSPTSPTITIGFEVQHAPGAAMRDTPRHGSCCRPDGAGGQGDWSLTESMTSTTLDSSRGRTDVLQPSDRWNSPKPARRRATALRTFRPSPPEWATRPRTRRRDRTALAPLPRRRRLAGTRWRCITATGAALPERRTASAEREGVVAVPRKRALLAGGPECPRKRGTLDPVRSNGAAPHRNYHHDKQTRQLGAPQGLSIGFSETLLSLENVHGGEGLFLTWCWCSRVLRGIERPLC